MRGMEMRLAAAGLIAAIMAAGALSYAESAPPPQDNVFTTDVVFLKP
jgi:hypothetical protein